jgi:peptidoglycan hydrolase-like protein with peptidoglycan-binding domain
VTGVVGEQTWPRLVVTLASGARGDAVRALQVQLGAKYDASVAVTGAFDAATVSVLRRFQGHMGLPRSGRADIATWRNLVWHYEYPDFGLASLCDYTDSTGGNGTAGNWGTASTVAQIEAAAGRFAPYGRGGVGIGDISLHHGGEIAGHSTHEVGLDVDVRPIRKDERQCAPRGGSTWRSSRYDRAATRTLIREIRAAAPGQVKVIYFNDPVLIDEGHTVWYRGHDGHLHIRYCEATHPDRRYRCATAGGPSAVGEASAERDGSGIRRPARILRRAVLTGAGTEPVARAAPVPH